MGEFLPRDKKICIDTIYFGGGTPSLLNTEQLQNLLETARECFDVSEECEITLECNPSSEGLEKFILSAAKLGVNRISLGMQSSTDSERKKLGRLGNARDVENAVGFIRRAGIENISLDIMVGVPDSTMDTLKSSLDFAIGLEIPHISSYMLKIEEGTYYYKNREKLNIPSDDEVSDMYLFMSDYLKKQGYSHYEISNFCKEGFHSRHNMKYWTSSDYIGIGAAAHSFFGGKRFYFPPDKDAFIEGNKAVFDSPGGDEEERLMLSLRTSLGISLEGKNSRFMKKIQLFEKGGLGAAQNGRFSLTAKGWLVSNSVILQLLDS